MNHLNDSYERVMQIVHRNETALAAAVTPVSVANRKSMQASGAYFPLAHTNADRMAALAAVAHEVCGFDTVAPCVSIHHEAAALGCTINWGTPEVLPTVTHAPKIDQSAYTVPSDFLNRPSIRTVLSALRLLKKTYQGRVAVIGKVMGPLTLAYHLCGAQNFIMDTLLRPAQARRFLETLAQVSLLFAGAQIEAGADILTWADHATGDLISASAYRSLLLPIHRQCVQKLKESFPGTPLILHTCGNTMDRIDDFKQTGFDIFHFDSRNDVGHMLSRAGSQMLLSGCVNNPHTLLNGSPEDVSAQVKAILRQGIRLVSPECAIPLRTKTANLCAISAGVREFNAHA